LSENRNSEINSLLEKISILITNNSSRIEVCEREKNIVLNGLEDLKGKILNYNSNFENKIYDYD